MRRISSFTKLTLYHLFSMKKWHKCFYSGKSDFINMTKEPSVPYQLCSFYYVCEENFHEITLLR